MTSIIFDNTMQATIRYWFPDNTQCKLASFSDQKQALAAIRSLSDINVRAELTKRSR